MTDQVEEIEHPKWPDEGEHFWGEWSPNNHREKYRVCLHPDCKAMQVREALA